MPVIIPLPGPESATGQSPGSIVRELVLDQVDVQIWIDWNERVSRWVITLADDAGQPVVAGKIVEVGVVLNASYMGDAWPPGLLVAWRADGEEGDIGRADLGVSAGLVWYTQDEVDALIEEAQPVSDLVFVAGGVG